MSNHIPSQSFFSNFTLHVNDSPIRGLDFYGERQPADGGDFFELIPLRGRLFAAVGEDLTGRAIVPAMIVSGLQAFLQSLTANSPGSPLTVIEDLNRVVGQMSPGGSLATLFYSRIDPGRRQLHYVNAGHPPALLARPENGRVYRLTSTGPALGLSNRSVYRMGNFSLEPGDVLVAFSEGITERDTALLELLKRHPTVQASQLVGLIMDAVNHCGPPRRAVDQTVVVVRFHEAASIPVPEDRATEVALAAA